MNATPPLVIEQHPAASGVAATALLLGPIFGFPTMPLLFAATSLASDCNAIYERSAMAGMRAVAPASFGGTGNVSRLWEQLVADGKYDGSSIIQNQEQRSQLRAHHANYDGALGFVAIALVVAPFLFHLTLTFAWALVSSCMKSSVGKRKDPYQRKGSMLERHGVVVAAQQQQLQQQQQQRAAEQQKQHSPAAAAAAASSLSSNNTTSGKSGAATASSSSTPTPTPTAPCIGKIPWSNAIKRLVFPELSASLIYACTPLLLFLSVRVISNDDGDSNVAGGAVALVFSLGLFALHFYATYTCAHHTAHFYTDVRGIEAHASTEWDTATCPSVLWLYYDPDEFKKKKKQQQQQQRSRISSSNSRNANTSQQQSDQKQCCMGVGCTTAVMPSGGWLSDDARIRMVCQMTDPAHEPGRDVASSSSCVSLFLQQVSLARAFRCTVRPFKIKYCFIAPVCVMCVSLLTALLLALPSARVSCSGIYVFTIICSVLFATVCIFLRPFRNPQDNVFTTINSLFAIFVIRTALNGAAPETAVPLFLATGAVTMVGIVCSICSAAGEEYVWEPQLIEMHLAQLSKLQNDASTIQQMHQSAARTGAFDSVVFGHQGMSDEGWGDDANSNNTQTTTATAASRSRSAEEGSASAASAAATTAVVQLDSIPTMASPKSRGHHHHSNNHIDDDDDDDDDDGGGYAVGRNNNNNNHSRHHNLSDSDVREGLSRTSATNVSYFRRQQYLPRPSSSAADASNRADDDVSVGSVDSGGAKVSIVPAAVAATTTTTTAATTSMVVVQQHQDEAQLHSVDSNSCSDHEHNFSSRRSSASIKEPGFTTVDLT